MTMISTKGRYALRVMIDLAMRADEEFVPLKAIAQRQEISEKYLEAIMKNLVQQGLVVGLRGKGGGYRLGKAARRIHGGQHLESHRRLPRPGGLSGKRGRKLCTQRNLRDPADVAGALPADRQLF